MSLATVRSCALSGIDALPITVEVYLGGGLPGMTIVGLPQSAVRESKDRVRAAIKHAGFRYPQVKIIVNLAPADLPKRGGRFDLPIALGILIASGQLPSDAADGFVVVGELGLGGELRSIEGALPSAQACRDAGESMVLPEANRDEALRIPGVSIAGVASLSMACKALLQRDGPLYMTSPSRRPGGLLERQGSDPPVIDSQGIGPQGNDVDLRDVVGQLTARRALEVAAAGGHNLLFSGAPGTGKSMLASRLPGILPPMTEREASEAAAIASISHLGFDPANWGVRPFRAPHHTVSGIALVGGGSPPMPGEVSLSHEGVLFLDELTEFRRPVLEVLREPMESGHVSVSRATWQANFPARFQLVAAMNPCPCGMHGEPTAHCACAPEKILQYRSRISMPFLDRIDMHVDIRRELLSFESVQGLHEGDQPALFPIREASACVRARTCAARDRQLSRQGCSNASLSSRQVGHVCRLDSPSRQLLEKAAGKHELSVRGVHRVLRVARTIADLDGVVTVSAGHLGEAIAYRERSLVPDVPTFA